MQSTLDLLMIQVRQTTNQNRAPDQSNSFAAALELMNSHLEKLRHASSSPNEGIALSFEALPDDPVQVLQEIKNIDETITRRLDAIESRIPRASEPSEIERHIIKFFVRENLPHIREMSKQTLLQTVKKIDGAFAEVMTVHFTDTSPNTKQDAFMILTFHDYDMEQLGRDQIQNFRSQFSLSDVSSMAPNRYWLEILYFVKRGTSPVEIFDGADFLLDNSATTPQSFPCFCHNCGKAGHFAYQCTVDTRCSQCSGPHHPRHCDKKNKAEFKCPNCGGKHGASDPNCRDRDSQKEHRISVIHRANPPAWSRKRRASQVNINNSAAAIDTSQPAPTRGRGRPRKNATVKGTSPQAKGENTAADDSKQRRLPNMFRQQNETLSSQAGPSSRTVASSSRAQITTIDEGQSADADTMDMDYDSEFCQGTDDNSTIGTDSTVGSITSRRSRQKKKSKGKNVAAPPKTTPAIEELVLQGPVSYGSTSSAPTSSAPTPPTLTPSTSTSSTSTPPAPIPSAPRSSVTGGKDADYSANPLGNGEVNVTEPQVPASSLESGDSQVTQALVPAARTTGRIQSQTPTFTGRATRRIHSQTPTPTSRTTGRVTGRIAQPHVSPPESLDLPRSQLLIGSYRSSSPASDYGAKRKRG
ncbi:unnamed protein product [Fusarium venenatum]|uniref:CCHC-type domain-containing protein n=1 Tax=Fusarium venenatum TaxID=56646 RepID=A0A2L2T0G1_9HYPO|nr:uncharacterized protein FVRRES_11200 [Fusarium venenatum]CEI38509.1 unnamed protein product [Fusarium venenatum]